ncbi:Hsp20 family protein [uncultured Bartonella sp.]|uniref:Hsp20 family protein n=1 Tax=uncultured Bartonella sp. TaxID=104108 RepID=UPI00262DD0FE|nr:Hsp20 family protein [uncultured Bartonella sp.]
MTRMTPFSNPLLLGFETMEKTLDRLSKSADGYPPYNIVRLSEGEQNERLRITLAVAGFTSEDISVTVEDNQLVIRGQQAENEDYEYLHRGIASRQFQRAFVLAEGIKVGSAELKNGLLSIDLERLSPEKRVKRITIIAAEDE